MTEKNANEMPSGQNDEKILVLEEMPSKGKAARRTTALTGSVRDEILSRLEERTERTTIWSFPSMAACLSIQERAMIPNATQRDNPLTAFMSKLIVHFDAMDTESDLKSIYVVSANIYRLNSLSDCRIDSFPKLIRLSRTMSFSVQKLREEEKLINDGMMIDSTKIDWKKLENDFGVKVDWLTRKGQVDTPLHLRKSDAVKATLPPKSGYNDSFDTKARFSPTVENQWLRTEYNTAILRARSAVQYRDALRTKALNPSLEYLKSHPYTRGQGDPHCPECRRQGLVKSSDLLDLPVDRLCPMHKEAEMAAKVAEIMKRYEGFAFEKERRSKSHGSFQRPMTKKYQNDAEQEKNERAFIQFAKLTGQRVRALPVVNDGRKNPDGLLIDTGEIVDVKSPDGAVTKTTIQNGIKEANKQGSSIALLDLRQGVSATVINKGLYYAFVNSRNRGIKTVYILMPGNEVRRYEVDLLREIRRGKH